MRESLAVSNSAATTSGHLRLSADGIGPLGSRPARFQADEEAALAGRLHICLSAVDAAGAIRAIALFLLNLRRAISFGAPYLEGVFPFPERPVKAPDHPGSFRERRPQLGLFPGAAVYPNLDFGDTPVSSEGDTTDGD